MNLEPIADYLQEQMPLTSVFLYHMPETVKSGVMLLFNLNGAQHTDIKGYKKGLFLAIVRALDFPSGYALAKQIMGHLELNRARLNENYYIHSIRPLRDPVAFPVSKGDYTELSVEYSLIFSET